MKIGIYFIDEGKQAGGTFTFSEEVINHLNNQKFEKCKFILLAENFDKKNSSIKKINNFEKVIKIKRGRIRSYFENIYLNFNIINQNFNYQSPIDKICEREKIDFIWFLDVIPDRLTDYPYATTVLDLEHLKQSFFPEWGNKINWFRRNNKLGDFLKKSTFIMTGTEIGKKEIENFYGIYGKKIYLNPHPTPDKFKNLKYSITKFDELIKKKFFFYPANLWPHKNHINLILAMEIFLKNNDANILFVGNEFRNKKILENLAKKLNIENNIHFLGFVDDADLLKLYKNAICLLYPSWGGPENLPPLEAFSLGCPVIANSIPGAVEQLGDNAILVDCSDPKLIAEKMRVIFIDENLRKELIVKGKARAKNWGINNYVNEYVKNFEKYFNKYQLNFFEKNKS